MADYDELTGSQSPGGAGFSRQGGRASLVLKASASTITSVITTLLGSVERGSDGRLRRTVAAAHPQFPWMVAERISNIKGIGSYSQAAAIQPVEGVALTYFAQYSEYHLDVEFVHQPWSAKLDSAITMTDFTYYDDDGIGVSSRYANEWDRYTSYELIPSADLVTATHGSSKFRTTANTAPNGFTYPGAPRVYVGKAVLKLTWHFVPHSLVTDPASILVSYLGCVNQTAFFGYPAGSLLYTAVGVRRYVPPVPYSVINGNSVAFSNEYNCDIEFVFEYTDRQIAGAYAPQQSNWLAAGHNLLPWFRTRGFYYVTSTDGTSGDTDETKWAPLYLSAPFEHLFTDPKVIT